MSGPSIYGEPEAAKSLCETATRIADDVAGPAAAEVDRGGRFPSAAMAALAGAGFYGMLLDPSVGGMGQGARVACAVVERLAAACGSTAMIFVMHSLAARALAAAPALEEKPTLLRQIASGERLCTLAYSEASSRSNFWIQGSVLAGDGDDCIFDGTKTWVTAAEQAHLMVTAARSPRATHGTEFTVFLTRRDAPTVHVLGGYDGLGLRGNGSCPVRFEHYRVPRADLLTAHGEGRPFSGTALVAWFDLLTAAMSNGLCCAAVSLTATHLKTTPLEHDRSLLRDLPNLRARLAHMAVLTEQSRALLAHALGQWESPSAATKVSLLSTRYAAIQAAVEVTDLAMKTCGGAAYRKEVAVERVFRDARAGWVMGPTADVLAELIGRELTGLDPL